MGGIAGGEVFSERQLARCVVRLEEIAAEAQAYEDSVSWAVAMGLIDVLREELYKRRAQLTLTR